MAEDLPHIRNHIADAITTSTSSTPYGTSNIRSRLDVEQQLLDTEASKGGDIAMAATNKGGNTYNRDCVLCGNCGNTSHPTKDCFGKGGVMEGKCNKVLASATGKPGSLCYDTSGRAYLLDSETNQAIYMAEPSPSPAPPSTSTEFVGLASDSITPAFIGELSAGEEDEYTTLLAAVDSFNTNLDWQNCTHLVDFAGLTYRAPNQRQCTIMDPSIIPFFLDSGASIHIINGISGSSIQAIGIGTLRLVVARSIHITLENVLFIPAAMVQLVSVSALCAAHRCVVSFDATNCWVQAHSGTRMLSGTLTSRRLYALSGGQLSAEHALLTHQVPTLQSWHCHLGHVNYCVVYDLARSGNTINEDHHPKDMRGK
ncbi:hypothetical protein DEU56DRAFT_912038 [Suillus clintonianus]|uniref:uncharacterized protein n=1 Tax=Suillus clintonianus TaxID=1904413 RepID=UPI001B883CE4|nr:uncharacterized protein DEU56DRAFT_912038 [Suillus clintonianus]KAG2139774.1 hypothetical protein DEU56DRAFT_912038 [Suillus clintonianus]